MAVSGLKEGEELFWGACEIQFGRDDRVTGQQSGFLVER
jgi:hypothetical protein